MFDHPPIDNYRFAIDDSPYLLTHPIRHSIYHNCKKIIEVLKDMFIASIASSVVALIVVTILMGTKSTVFAASADAVTPGTTNSGFIVEPPHEWKKRFPMCEAYLDVEWIDPGRNIGYSTYETWVKGKKKTIWALVTLDVNPPRFDYDVYQYVRKGKLKDLFATVKNGRVFANYSPLSVRSRSKAIDLYPIGRPVLSNFEKTACIVFPDQQRALIIEGKKVGNAYTESRINEMYRTMEIFVPSLSMQSFKELIAIDLNFDGVDDYFEDGWVTYSFGDKYFSMKRGENQFQHGRSQFPFSFPTNGRLCTLTSWPWSYLITDGKSYILNNECTLTDLTTAPANVKREGKRPGELDIPDEARQLVKRGTEAFNAKNSRSAVDLLDKAVEIAPWWAEANYQRGFALVDVNMYGAALRDMRRVQTIVGDTPVGKNAQEKIKAWQEPLRRLAVGEMVEIPPGRFLMGSPDACDPHCGFCRCAQPQHWVDIKRFEISKYPITFDQWEACVEDGGCARQIAFANRWTGRSLPATSMNWQTVQDYIGWINKKTGKQYRLPSEAEWEYAARAGTTTKYYWGNEVSSGHANRPGYVDPFDSKSASPVGSFAPNVFGLYNMAGNIWQWLEDCDNPDYKGAPTDGSAWSSGNCRARVIRGGSRGDKTMGSADRSTEEIQYGPSSVGFRLARTLK